MPRLIDIVKDCHVTLSDEVANATRSHSINSLKDKYLYIEDNQLHATSWTNLAQKQAGEGTIKEFCITNEEMGMMWHEVFEGANRMADEAEDPNLRQTQSLLPYISYVNKLIRIADRYNCPLTGEVVLIKGLHGNESNAHNSRRVSNLYASSPGEFYSNLEIRLWDEHSHHYNDAGHLALAEQHYGKADFEVNRPLSDEYGNKRLFDVLIRLYIHMKDCEKPQINNCRSFGSMASCCLSKELLFFSAKTMFVIRWRPLYVSSLHMNENSFITQDSTTVCPCCVSPIHHEERGMRICSVCDSLFQVDANVAKILLLGDRCHECSGELVGCRRTTHLFDDMSTERRKNGRRIYDNDQVTYYGVESEIDFILEGDSDDNRFFILRNSDVIENVNYLMEELEIIAKFDGSLNENGLELECAPLTYEEWKKKYDLLISLYGCLHKLGYERTWRAGFHVHVSRTNLQATTLYKICKIFRYLSREESPNIYELAGRHPSFANHFKQFSTVDTLQTAKRNLLQDIRRHSNYGMSRYKAVNLSNHSTVEFRLFGGVANASNHLANVAAVDMLIRVCNKSKLTTTGKRLFTNFLDECELGGDAFHREILKRFYCLGNVHNYHATWPCSV